MRVEGHNSHILSIHPEIVQKAGINAATMMEQELLRDGSIKLKPVKFL